MAPEQARGKAVDKRADIWAFGAVLYEMLVGASPFSGGETVSDALASIIAREPDWATLPKDTPPHIRRLLARCLHKDSRLRLRDIGEARIVLDEPPAAALKPRTSRLPWALAAVATLVALAAIFVALGSPAPTSPPLMHVRMDLGPDAVAGARLTAAVSPDGSRIAYMTRGADGRQLIATRLFDQSAAVTLAGTDGGDDLFFSPDGQWIGYRSGYRLMKVSPLGGSPAVIAVSPTTIRGAAWSDDGTVVFGTATAGLYRVDPGGKLTQLTDPAKLNHSTDRWPQFLPGGGTLLYTGQFGTTALDDSEIVALNLKTGVTKAIHRGGYNARYLPSGHLVFFRQGSLFGLRFDPSRLETSGQPVRLLDGIASDFAFGGADFAASRNGTLLYHAGKSTTQGLPVVWLDTTGKTEELISRPDTYFAPVISPDGRFVAVVVANGSGPDIFVWDVQRQIMSPLTSDHRNNFYPVYPPGPGKWQISRDGGAWPRFTRDGKQLFYLSPDGHLMVVDYHAAELLRRTPPPHPII